MARIDISAAGGKNRVAFLDMIAVSEIGAAMLAKSDDGYNVLVGSTASRPLLFASYAAHPNVLNRQIPVPSTAAGRYQILNRWWRIYQAQMKLPDFGPVSQDRYALQQLREHGALPLIDAGRLLQGAPGCRQSAKVAAQAKQIAELAAERDEYRRRSTAQQEIATHAAKERDQARVDAAASAADGLRSQVAALVADARRTTASTGGSSASDALDLLADMLGRSDARAGG